VLVTVLLLSFGLLHRQDCYLCGLIVNYCYTMWSRDAILALRWVGWVQLDRQVREIIRCIGCSRRGRRGGLRVNQRLTRVESETTAPGKIPVVSTRRRSVSNNASRSLLQGCSRRCLRRQLQIQSNRHRQQQSAFSTSDPVARVN